MYREGVRGHNDKAHLMTKKTSNALFTSHWFSLKKIYLGSFTLRRDGDN